MTKNIEGEIEETVRSLAGASARTLDYEIGWMFAETVNEPTTYRGRGRPRKTDYITQKHPFDGKVKSFLNTTSTLWPTRIRGEICNYLFTFLFS